MSDEVVSYCVRVINENQSFLVGEIDFSSMPLSYFLSHGDALAVSNGNVFARQIRSVLH